MWIYLHDRNKGRFVRAHEGHALTTPPSTIGSASQSSINTHPSEWDNGDKSVPLVCVTLGPYTLQVYQKVCFETSVDMPPFPLAQSSTYSSGGSGCSERSSRGLSMASDSSIGDPDNRKSKPPVSGTISAIETLTFTYEVTQLTREEGSSSVKTVQDFRRLEILSTATLGSSSTSIGGSLSGFQGHSLNISPLQVALLACFYIIRCFLFFAPPLTTDANPDDSGSGRSTKEDNFARHHTTNSMLLFNVQGWAMAPALYVVLQSQLH